MPSFSEHEFELAGSGIELRTAGPEDQDLVRRILAMATHWRASDIPHELPANVAAYHEQWGRPGDIGVFAFSGIEFAGGAYVRTFGPTDGTYGFVDVETPELTIGVEPAQRRRGIAVLLLAALKAKVVEAGHRGISLSVEPDNHAKDLYTKMGFDLVEQRETDVLMLWQLSPGANS